MSPKRQRESKEYTKLRNAFLEELPQCEACFAAKSVDVHHREGRRGNYLKVATWMAVCRKCHDAIHRNPIESREKGYLV